MKQELLHKISQLSFNDRKTLSQKVLKAAEELGELAKAILPIDDAHSTTHRFADKKKALEEVSDTMLCLLSVSYDLGFSYEDLEEMMEHKSKVWEGLQAKEGAINTSKIPFEIHVTVSNSSVDTFKKACFELNVKPILLDLHLKNAGVMKDLMTSSTFVGTNNGAYTEMKRISSGLKTLGFNVLREKIETVPWHPAAPSINFNHSKMPSSCYFESHLGVLSKKSRLDDLSKIADKYGAKRSTNVWKDYGDEQVKIMITLRSSNLFYEPFIEKLHGLKDAIIENGFVVDKEIVEFSIFDTKISHDASWISE